MWMYNQTSTNALYHYGTIGMRWGIRRYQNRDGTYTSAGKKRKSSSNDGEPKKSLFSRKKKTKVSVKDLSDDEINRRINRLTIEKKYEQLIAERESSTATKARKAVGKLLMTMGDKAVTEIGTGVGKLITTAFIEGPVAKSSEKNKSDANKRAKQAAKQAANEAEKAKQKEEERRRKRIDREFNRLNKNGSGSWLTDP